MSAIQNQILALLQTSLIAEETKKAWKEKFPALTESEQTELLTILQAEQKMVESAIQTEQQKSAAQNQAIYRQLLVDMKDLAQTFQKTGLKTVEKKSQAEENDVLKSIEQELSNL